MRLPHRRPTSLLPAFVLGTAALTGCIFETKVAGGAEDFPNTIASLGATASEDVNSHADWDQFSNIPAIDLKDADSLVMGPPAKAGAQAPVLAKSGAPQASGAAPTATGAASRETAPADTTFDLSDTATLGVGRRYIRDENLVRVITDTVIFKWNEKARDTIRGNEYLLMNSNAEVRRSGFIKAYRFDNLDTDSGYDRAVFYERNPRLGEIFHHKLFVVKPGPDGDFAARADNRPVYYATARTLGADTLDAFDVSDGDGDGQLWGDNDSGIVNVRSLQTDPAFRPAVARYTQAMRAVFFKTGGKTYPIAFQETRTDRNGRKVVFSVKGPRADSAFGPGDTVTVTVKTTAGPDEEVRFLEKTSRFRIRLSSTPGQFASNALVRFTMETRWREGAFRRGQVIGTRITFTPDEPLTSGNLVLTGAILIEAEFADGTTGSAAGFVKDKRIEVDLTELKAGLKLRRFRVSWDAAADGKVLSQERLPD